MVVDEVTTVVGCCFFLPGEAAADSARSKAVPRAGLAPKAAPAVLPAPALLGAAVLVEEEREEEDMALLLTAGVATPNNGVVEEVGSALASPKEVPEEGMSGAVFTP